MFKKNMGQLDRTLRFIVGVALIYRGSFLQYPVQWAGSIILMIETTATVSIGAILAALFLGYRPRSKPITGQSTQLKTGEGES